MNRERLQKVLVGLGVFAAFYAFTFFMMTLIAASRMKSWTFVFFITNIIVAGMSVLVFLAWLYLRSMISERTSRPAGGPDYERAMGHERDGDLQGAIGEYRRLHEQWPENAEPLWRMAHIYRDRLGDRQGYRSMLKRIASLPEGAGPGWTITQAREKLDLMDPEESRSDES